MPKLSSVVLWSGLHAIWNYIGSHRRISSRLCSHQRPSRTSESSKRSCTRPTQECTGFRIAIWKRVKSDYRNRIRATVNLESRSIAVFKSPYSSQHAHLFHRARLQRVCWVVVSSNEIDWCSKISCCATRMSWAAVHSILFLHIHMVHWNASIFQLYIQFLISIQFSTWKVRQLHQHHQQLTRAFGDTQQPSEIQYILACIIIIARDDRETNDGGRKKCVSNWSLM